MIVFQKFIKTLSSRTFLAVVSNCLVCTSKFCRANNLHNLSKMSSRVPRWFDNPFPDCDSGTIEIPTDRKALKEQGLSLLEEAFARGTRSGNGGLYVGAVGITYMYLHVAHLLTLEEKQKYSSLAVNAFQVQAAYNQEHLRKRNDVPGFLLGNGGFFAVGAVLGKETGNENLMNECTQKYVEAADICKPIDYLPHGSDELFVGRAGYLCGALWLQQKLGYMPVPEEDLGDIWISMVESGNKYSQLNNSPCSLMYSYYDTEYLGAAHGLSSILQILLSFPKFLIQNPAAEQLIKNSVDYYLTLQDSLGNFPCALDEIVTVGGSTPWSQDNMVLHWCHGAPGAIYMFAKAYLHYKDKKYLDACVKCGEAVWTRGLLRKGPGICHGVAGNGYVFLVVYNLLEQKDKKHLYRALKFAEFISNPKFIKEARRPDQPYSLYEGKAGAACFLMDLLQPEDAEFPFFNVNINYG